MSEYALFLRLLAEEIYAAHLRDASDFHEWLLEASKKAAESCSVEEFFSRLRRGA